jgi:glycerophosphoryl diester phosphodiesterase
VGDVSLDELRAQCPDVPTLAQIISRFGKRVHLMVEVKQEPYPQPVLQNEILKELFAPLTAGRDYHLLSLAPQMFDLVTFAPREACFPIAQTRVAAFSRLAADGGFGGLCGHYLLVTDPIVAVHHHLGQQVGTGYIGSRNCLFRELRRGVDYIFSNCAVRMQQMVEALILQG